MAKLSKLVVKERSRILTVYKRICKSLKERPDEKTLSEKGVKMADIAFAFVNIDGLHKEARKRWSEEFEFLNIFNNKREEILNKYIELTKTYPYPEMQHLFEVGISRAEYRNYFHDITGLRKAAIAEHPEAFPGTLLREDIVDIIKRTRQELKGKNKFLVTTAVTGQFLVDGALASMKKWASNDRKKAIVIMPSVDYAHNLDAESDEELTFDPEVVELPLLFEDIQLNSRIKLSSYPVPAKMVNPLNQLESIAQEEGSMIVGSPKQRLSYGPVGVEKKYPHFFASTGSCTAPNYKTTRGTSLRSGWISTKKHQVRGYIIEVVDKKLYHARPFCFEPDGSFIDLGIRYSSNGIELAEKYLIEKYVKTGIDRVPFVNVRGDAHAGETDESALRGSETLMDLLGIKDVYENDFFSGESINPHTEDDLIIRVQNLERRSTRTLESELEVAGELLKRTLTNNRRVYLIPSNHHDFIYRFIKKGDYNKDAANALAGMRIAECTIRGEDPLMAGLRMYGKISNFTELIKNGRIVFLRALKDEKFGGRFIIHGHKGRGGKKNPGLKGVQRGWGMAVMGHTHSPAIYDEVINVGTLMNLRPGYNDTPSGWMHCDGLLYAGGSFQLINYINGEFAHPDTMKLLRQMTKNNARNSSSAKSKAA